MRVALDDVAQRLKSCGTDSSNALPKVILLNGNEPLLVGIAFCRTASNRI